MKIKEFTLNGIIVARLIPSDQWKEGLSFFSIDKEYIQVGTWNYPKGKELLPHIHNQVVRSIDRTQEVLFVKKGSIRATIYSLKGKIIGNCIVKEGDILILLSCGHGYKILENGTQVLEVKNGPYKGAEIDRRRI